MEKLFLAVFHKGMTAGYLILAVAAARILLKKAPRSMICVLWMIVGIRLLCPLGLHSEFSLLQENTDLFADGGNAAFSGEYQQETGALLSGQRNMAETEKQDPDPNIKSKTANSFIKLVFTANKFIRDNIGKMRNSISSLTGTIAENIPEQAVQAAAYLWLAGMAGMFGFYVFRWFVLKKSLATAIPQEHEGTKFYRCDAAVSPFLFGIVSPKIYVPFSVSQKDLCYVLKHERAHQRRRDHLTVWTGYLLRAVYWFQPLVWAAYMMFCRDIELACDEMVIKELGEGCKKAYAKSLLDCSVQRASGIYPVAFGEIGVKKRVKNILNYSKPNVGVLLTAIAVCIMIIVCFATEAESRKKPVSRDTSARTEHLTEWAEAFCRRDGSAVSRMLSSAGRWSLQEANMLEDQNLFGWSSPWPWEAGLISEQKNYRILSVKDKQAVILYYAWTSDPHVTVWRQTVDFTYAAKKDRFIVNGAVTSIMDQIHTAEEFYAAYPDGIDGTGIDYYRGNGTGSVLNQNAVRSMRDQNFADSYAELQNPDTAAVFLLNIANDPSEVKTKVSEKNGHTYITFTFLEDHSLASVKMIQPYGKNGIWIPQTDTEADL